MNVELDEWDYLWDGRIEAIKSWGSGFDATVMLDGHRKLELHFPQTRAARFYHGRKVKLYIQVVDDESES